jgi:hypothetical protein
VRVDALYELGGIYLDWDVFALRDIKQLRQSGFSNVVGRQADGDLNSGCFMSGKQTTLMKLWMQNQHDMYDGLWTTHSNGLLTALSEELLPSLNEVLILDQNSFAPGSWEAPETALLFESHNKPSASPESGNTSVKGDGVTQEEAASATWIISYSSSYVIHAFNRQKVPGFEGITLNYVLDRQSNFARAVYPAVQNALHRGVISIHD